MMFKISLGSYLTIYEEEAGCKMRSQVVAAEYWKKLKQIHKDPRMQKLKKIYLWNGSWNTFTLLTVLW